MQQILPRRQAPLVVLPQPLILPQLLRDRPPGGSPPQGIGGRPHEHRHPGLREGGKPRFLQDLLQARRLLGARPGSKEVVKRDRAVGFAAPEGGLDLDHRIPRPPAEAGQDGGQQAPQPPRQIRPVEEGRRVPILQRPPARHHIGEIGGEDGLVQPSLPDVAAGADDRRPRGQGAGGRRWGRRQAGPLQVVGHRAEEGLRLGAGDGLAGVRRPVPQLNPVPRRAQEREIPPQLPTGQIQKLRLAEEADQLAQGQLAHRLAETGQRLRDLLLF